MVSVLQPEPPHAPSAAWLFCAACGPVSAGVAQLAGMPLEDEPGLLGAPRNYEVAEPVPFPRLRRWVAQSSAVQEALVRAENVRSKDATRKRQPSHEEMAARARTALLLGRGKDFLRLYQLYTASRDYEWHPDPQHVLFWERVLGPGWHGSDAVPKGEARDEIVLLTADACAFFPMPQEAAAGKGLCGAPAGVEWLEVAAALRAARLEELTERASLGCAVSQPAVALLAGHPNDAQRLFEGLIGRAEDRRYALLAGHGLPVLLYALMGGVLGGASLRFIKPWLEHARYIAEFVFPPSMEGEQGELMRFLDNLEMVDNVVNRNGTLMQEPSIGGALSLLPFALMYKSLPAYVHRGIPGAKLAESVQELAQQGLRLPAQWGARGLLGAEGLTAEQQDGVAALAAEVAGSSAPAPLPVTERALAALLEVAQKPPRRGSRLAQSRGAMPAMFVASCAPTGAVVIRMEEADDLEMVDDSPALRCMQRYTAHGLLVLEGANRVEYTRLFASLQHQVDVVGSLAMVGETPQAAAPEPVVLFSHEGGASFCAAFRLRLLPGASPLMVAGCGLEIPVVELADGEGAVVQRELEKEWLLLEGLAARLRRAGAVQTDALLYGVASLDGFGELAAMLHVCRSLGVEVCWEQGHALRLLQPQGSLKLCPGESVDGWLELGGTLPVDEGRVLELSHLLAAFASREDNTMKLAAGEYVLLTPALERQLALLDLICREKKGRLGTAASAIPLLEALKDGEPVPAAPPAPAATIPAGLKASLRPYQQEGFRWLAERARLGLGALLADDMGLGKTVQVLALLLHAAKQPGAGASLVVAPVSLLGNWAEEAARFAPSLPVLLYDSREAQMPPAPASGSLVLVSYGQLVARQKEFAAVAWDVLVLDEAQAVKNPDSQRARVVCSLRARARFCLTGTPIENSLLDVWSQMRFLNPGLLGTRVAFLRRFKKTGTSELALLRRVLAPLVLRRTKAEVLSQLPPLTETVEWVDFSPEERALYESMRRAAVSKLGGDERDKRINILAELTRLRRACCHGRLVLPGFEGSSAKLTAVLERVAELRAAGRRVLVFSQFTDVLDLAQEALQAAHIRCLRLDGSTPAAQRTRLVRDFQQGGADAFLISLKAGGAGLNLTAADDVMLLDPWWNPAVEAQAAGRSHRMGQKHPVTLCRFMVRGTVEERIADLHRDKKELAEQVLSGKAEGLSLDKLCALLG